MPELAGQTEDQAQDALAATNLAFGDERRALERDRARGPGHPHLARRPGRPSSPAPRVDLVLSRGRKPITIKDWTGKPFDDAAGGAGAARARGQRDRRGVQRHRRRGRRHLPGPDHRHALPRRHRLASSVSLGPELVEVPRVEAMGVEAATELLEGLGFEVETEEADELPRPRLRLQLRPRCGRATCRRAPRSRSSWSERPSLPRVRPSRPGVRRCWRPPRCWPWRPAGARRSSSSRTCSTGCRRSTSWRCASPSRRVALLLVAPRALGRLSPVVRRHAVVLGLLYGVAQILQTAGLAHTPASVSGFVTGLYVVCTPLLAAAILRTRIPPITWVAVVLATVGLGVLALRRLQHRLRRADHAGLGGALRPAHRRARRVVDRAGRGRA